MFAFLLICLLAGSLGAILQGMLGVGTGIIIMPLLTFLLPYYGMNSDLAVHVALTTTMSFIVISSISAARTHQRKGNVQWIIFKKIIFFSIIGAFLGALLASYFSGHSLKIIFGFFMLCLAFYMFNKKRNSESTNENPFLSHKKMAAGGFSIGFVGSFIGAGGSVLMVPFLHSQKIKMQHAVGTSTLIGLPVTIMGSLTYILIGLLHPAAPLTIGYLHWPAFLAIAFAGFICAPIGAKLSTKLSTHFLQRLFAVCMLVVGLKMIF